MNTADWALAVSFGSMLIAAAAFIWNVWAKFILPKPKLDVSFNAMKALGNVGFDGNIFVLATTNVGPFSSTIKMAVVRMQPKRFWQRHRTGVLNPLHNFPLQTNFTLGPFSGGLPKQLGIGEEFSLYFPYNAESELAEVERVGVLDTFGRSHWCSTKQMRHVKERFGKDFGETGLSTRTDSFVKYCLEN